MAQATSNTTPAPGPGSYFWRAFYDGDVNYAPVSTLCQEAGETTVVNQLTPTIVTQATPTATPGQPISDVATVTGGPAPAPAPTGTVDFRLYSDPTCTTVIFEDLDRPLTPTGPNVAQATSNTTPAPAPGSYFWRAFYDGDINYAPVSTPCGDLGETTVVTRVVPMIVTQALSPVTLSQPIRDTATLSGGIPPGPTGTITFTLFGPGNPTCVVGPGQPVFTSTVPVSGNGDYVSADFVPTAVGEYQWVAVYSGDANNAPATSPCGAPNEVSVVTVQPTVNITKTPDPNSRPEPGGDFTYTVVVTNTSTEVLTIQTLTDSVYGNLVTRPAPNTCQTAVGTVLAVGATYTCAFTAPFFAPPGTALTDIATVTAVNPTGVVVTDNDDAVVTITPVPPAIEVIKDVTPGSLPEPGGVFTYTVTVRNPGTVETITINSLIDSVYGDLATRPGSTCGTLINTTLAPGATSTPCTFTAEFLGDPGDAETDIVTA
ncbi:MAG: Ig-like domain repeat protein, partial [Actinobacteria bacterium]|nr:Ig-like domain repeat protein [Actinomycetota bacterium]